MSSLVLIADPPEASLDIVFIHGLGGNGASDWMADPRNPETFWPRWLGSSLDGARVWSVHYDAPRTNWGRKRAMSLQHRANNVLATLRSHGVGKLPLLFISHSLGGLVTKEVLLISEESTDEALLSIARSCLGVVFIASPHTGSDVARLAKHFPIMRPSTAVKALARDDGYLTFLAGRYRQLAARRGLSHLVLAETQPYRGTLVVPPSSADPGIADAQMIMVEANHSTIARPESESAFVYQQVVDFGRLVLERARRSETQGADKDPQGGRESTSANPTELPVARSRQLKRPVESLADCLILTTHHVELLATLAAFDVALEADRSWAGDLPLWIVSRDGRRYAIGNGATDGNTESALSYGRLYEAIHPRSAALLGMAGGVEGKVMPGDVVVADQIFAYDTRSRSVDRERNRVKTYQVPRGVIRGADKMRVVAPAWFTDVADDLREVLEGGVYGVEGAFRPELDWRPAVSTGGLLVGASLAPDDSPPQWVGKFNDRVKAAAMYGTGFAAAFSEVEVPWIVVQGIAGIGERGRRVDWQFGSMFAAASWLRAALRLRLVDMPISGS